VRRVSGTAAGEGLDARDAPRCTAGGPRAGMVVSVLFGAGFLEVRSTPGLLKAGVLYADLNANMLFFYLSR
jgi:hypothetical protein